MGKRRNPSKEANTQTVSRNAASLRAETSGKNPQSKRESNSLLRLDHLKNLAVWASKDAAIPSLGAFLGYQYAAAGEALGVQHDPLLFICQRCESNLQPGFNCTVRVESKRGKKQRRSKKPSTKTQNHVVYMCHYCSHRNIKGGTLKGHMKKICLPEEKPGFKPKPAKSMIQKNTVSIQKAEKEADQVEMIGRLNSTDGVTSLVDGTDPVTPLAMSCRITLLDSKRSKKRKSALLKKLAEAECNSGKTKPDNAMSSKTNTRIPFLL